MASYDRAEIVTKTVRYTIPAPPPLGAHPDEIVKALTAAHNECEAADKGTVSDLRFVPHDDSIAIEFDIECKDE
jgi:hypothetical protein